MSSEIKEIASRLVFVGNLIDHEHRTGRAYRYPSSRYDSLVAEHEALRKRLSEIEPKACREHMPQAVALVGIGLLPVPPSRCQFCAESSAPPTK